MRVAEEEEPQILPRRIGGRETQAAGQNRLVPLPRRIGVPGHGFETALCAGHAADLNSVAASVSSSVCAARI